MRISNEGQLTIPEDIREKTGLLPNTEVEFVIAGDKVYLQIVDHARGRKILEAMTGKGDVPLSTDDIMRLTRGD